MKESIDTCADESKKNKKKRGWMLWMQRVAAVLFLPLLIGTYLLYINQQKGILLCSGIGNSCHLGYDS